MSLSIRPCEPGELETVGAIINEAAEAYRGIIPADRWREPYMPAAGLEREVRDGVVFWGAYEGTALVGVMGLQPVMNVALIRHAYVRPAKQRAGVGQALLRELLRTARSPLLVGTWRAATWAIRFYERNGFGLVGPAETERLLRRYWSVPERQIEESVVLADPSWFRSRERARAE
jgi:GNAT superfamily N-acetyltransferase